MITSFGIQEIHAILSVVRFLLGVAECLDPEFLVRHKSWGGNPFHREKKHHFLRLSEAKWLRSGLQD